MTAANGDSEPLTTVQEAAAEVLALRFAFVWDESAKHTIVDGRIGVSALLKEGWRLIPPDDFPGLCRVCRTVVAEGTVHRPFNGNQMFACEIVTDSDGDA